jgi:hypothetical protein
MPDDRACSGAPGACGDAASHVDGHRCLILAGRPLDEQTLGTVGDFPDPPYLEDVVTSAIGVAEVSRRRHECCVSDGDSWAGSRHDDMPDQSSPHVYVGSDL